MYSHIGKIKNNNEDFGEINKVKKFKILIVADGVSTSENSKQASYIATKEISNYITKNHHILTKENMNSMLVEAVKSANNKVLSIKLKNKKRNSNTTIVCALIYDNYVSIVWLGDSRVYKIDKNKVDLITYDDSYVNLLKKKGYSESEIEEKRVSHIITQCLGMKNEDLNFHSLMFKINKPIDLLLCSDGFWNYFDNEEMHEIIKNNYNEDLLYNLIKKTNELGGKDNITIAYYKNNIF